MGDSFQDVYATYLQHRDYGIYGYPLRMPEPMSTLEFEPYQSFGLQIGDVGVVDRDGQFDVLFNICKDSGNDVNKRGVPNDFQPVELGEVKYNNDAINPGAIHSHGIRRILQPDQQSSVDYKFETSAPAGAVLILPQSVTSVTLLSPEQLREVAMQQALNWYGFARRRYNNRHFDRSLYLITGFYKTSSWSLGSFRNPTGDTGTILAQRDASNPSFYRVQSTFPADCRSHVGDDFNQTIFITGFKITVKSWFPAPLVLQLPLSETRWLIYIVCLFKAWLNRLRSSPHRFELPATIGVEDNPRLSQPFHPSDIINGFLLNKNPDAQIAVLHDSQWMDMMKVARYSLLILHTSYSRTRKD
ncbi:hypothetical protein EDD15DRAFT_1070489 [Pisolithus albus]|nr:hypothetical protein EDD15DRAFT_1070489 [Pisolithus albus]